MDVLGTCRAISLLQRNLDENAGGPFQLLTTEGLLNAANHRQTEDTGRDKHVSAFLDVPGPEPDIIQRYLRSRSIFEAYHKTHPNN